MAVAAVPVRYVSLTKDVCNVKMVKYYVLGAILACALAGYFAWYVPNLGLTIIFGWTGFSLIAVSSAYLLRYPELLRKRDDGAIPFYIRWIFVPFMLGSWLYNEYARRTDKVPPLQKIEESLFLGCRMSTQHVDLLNENDIGAILDVTAEFDGLDWTAYQEDFAYLNIPVLDHTSPTTEQLLHAINWLDQKIADGQKVVVHCALGRGRSVLVVAAYLLAKHPSLTIDEAMANIQSIRTTARLNKRQRSALAKIQQGGHLNLSKSLTLIANPVAGGGKWKTEKADILAQLNEKFRVTVEETTPDVDGEALAKKAVEEGVDIVVACGGDGTITEVASALADTDTTLGIIPLGTANALCQVLHGYTSKIMPVGTACEIIIDGHAIYMDTARCNDKMMLLVAAVGFEERMISAADRGEKDNGGQMAYLRGLWDAISQNDNLSFSLSLEDGPTQHIDTPSLVIANAAPVTTALAQGGEPPDVTDGKLDITWLTPQASADKQFLSLAELVLTTSESKQQSDTITHTQASSLTLEFDEEVSYALDGEIFNAKHIEINIQPRSLKVLSNADEFEDAK